MPRVIHRVVWQFKKKCIMCKALDVDISIEHISWYGKENNTCK